jgi:hypothetical protein
LPGTSQMTKRRIGPITTLVVMGAASALIGPILAQTAAPEAGQVRTYRAPRTADGTPDLNGIWQAMNTAHWDLQEHDQRQGPLWPLGAAFSVPAGAGVVVGNEIPYQPAALAKKREHAAQWLTLDPEIKCYLPGIPRATYMPYPFQIVQTPAHVVFAYAFANASRIVYMNVDVEAQIDTWMGYGSGRWDGETLVIDSKGFNDQTWFDRAGNYHSDALHVTERYTAISPDALQYEATIEDPKVFTRPWQIRMPLYRRLDQPARLVKYNCVEFAEDVIYGHLRKPPKTK